MNDFDGKQQFDGLSRLGPLGEYMCTFVDFYKQKQCQNSSVKVYTLEKPALIGFFEPPITEDEWGRATEMLNITKRHPHNDVIINSFIDLPEDKRGFYARRRRTISVLKLSDDFIAKDMGLVFHDTLRLKTFLSKYLEPLEPKTSTLLYEIKYEHTYPETVYQIPKGSVFRYNGNMSIELEQPMSIELEQTQSRIKIQLQHITAKHSWWSDLLLNQRIAGSFINLIDETNMPVINKFRHDDIELPISVVAVYDHVAKHIVNPSTTMPTYRTYVAILFLCILKTNGKLCSHYQASDQSMFIGYIQDMLYDPDLDLKRAYFLATFALHFVEQKNPKSVFIDEAKMIAELSQISEQDFDSFVRKNSNLLHALSALHAYRVFVTQEYDLFMNVKSSASRKGSGQNSGRKNSSRRR